MPEKKIKVDPEVDIFPCVFCGKAEGEEMMYIRFAGKPGAGKPAFFHMACFRSAPNDAEYKHRIVLRCRLMRDWEESNPRIKEENAKYWKKVKGIEKKEKLKQERLEAQKNRFAKNKEEVNKFREDVKYV